ncbi:uncharacterized protein DS421_5g146760 [Arachis hypogaea]|nr:uncharacterized protein DS421_5g146760 [Arachis hypogaea]
MYVSLGGLWRRVSSVFITSLSFSMIVRPIREISIKSAFPSQPFYHIFEVVAIIC